jgi:hypothetical protein
MEWVRLNLKMTSGNMQAFAGIGSRETPQQIQDLMTRISHDLQDMFTLRSGGADGADLAFERGITNGNMEIYLPFKGFNKNKSPLFKIHSDAYEIASHFHPAWHKLKNSHKAFHARNMHQILGKNLDSPVLFVLCWTKDGCESHEERTQDTGGTGQAISLASSLDIPVINMKNLLWKDRLSEVLDL